MYIESPVAVWNFNIRHLRKAGRDLRQTPPSFIRHFRVYGCRDGTIVRILYDLRQTRLPLRHDVLYEGAHHAKHCLRWPHT